MMDLHTIWYLLIGVLFAGYAILDGFDLGVGMLHLFTRDDTARRLALRRPRRQPRVGNSAERQARIRWRADHPSQPLFPSRGPHHGRAFHDARRDLPAHENRRRAA